MFDRLRLRLAVRLTDWALPIIEGKSRYSWQIIGDKSDPYVVRFKIFNTRWLKIYLHLFLRSDSDEALHDHPSHNLSFILSGAYTEWMPYRWSPNPPREFVGSDMVHHDYWPVNRILTFQFRKAGDLVLRHAAMPHRIELDKPGVITLFFMTGDVREWGFHCPHGWRHWKDYTNFSREGHSGSVGKGCGD